MYETEFGKEAWTLETVWGIIDIEMICDYSKSVCLDRDEDQGLSLTEFQLKDVKALFLDQALYWSLRTEETR